jgi:hypothetical protein
MNDSIPYAVDKSDDRACDNEWVWPGTDRMSGGPFDRQRWVNGQIIHWPYLS